MKNSLLAIFDEIWPKTMYYSTGSLATLKICKKIQILSESAQTFYAT